MSRPMASSEIDDIFASSKGKAKLSPSSSSQSQESARKTKATKARSTQRKHREGLLSGHLAGPQRNFRKAAGAMADPSLRPSSSGAPNTSKAAKSQTGREEKERFRDSRGMGSRRATEEGYLIYKEDELGITDKGGDTPLCPFDCDCCF